MIEIERKFLVNKALLPDLASFQKFRLQQGYLSKSAHSTVRVRLSNDSAFLTVKGKTENFSRKEFEYEIPFPDGQELLNLCESNQITKTRYLIPFSEHIWELDVFENHLSGLILAEVELQSENEQIKFPRWITKEISTDVRFFNSSLSLLNLDQAQVLLNEID